MKKTIRLTEKDLTRIVKRIVTEDMENVSEKIIQMVHEINETQETMVRTLYKSGLMSSSEAKEIKSSFDEIFDKVFASVMKDTNK
jgi:hypothetical protein